MRKTDRCSDTCHDSKESASACTAPPSLSQLQAAGRASHGPAAREAAPTLPRHPLTLWPRRGREPPPGHTQAKAQRSGRSRPVWSARRPARGATSSAALSMAGSVPHHAAGSPDMLSRAGEVSRLPLPRRLCAASLLLPGAGVGRRNVGCASRCARADPPYYGALRLRAKATKQTRQSRPRATVLQGHRVALERYHHRGGPPARGAPAMSSA